MRVKVYGGLHHGRVLVLPEGTRLGDYAELPVTLPPGEMFAPGRTHPDLHTQERVYRVEEGRSTGEKYLASAPMRFVRAVDVPPPPATASTVILR